MSENLENRINSEQAKDAIYKAHSMPSANKVDSVVLEERTLPTLFSSTLPYLKYIRLWKLSGINVYKTNIRAEKLFEDVFADAIYYVSPTGNDTTGTGTKSNPFRSIIKAFYTEYTSAKRTIYIEAGTYVDDNGFASVNIPSSITHLNIIGLNGLVISERTSDISNLKLKPNCKFYMENIVFKGGNYPLQGNMTDNSYSELYCKNCSFESAPSTSGFIWNGNGIIVMEKSIAKNNALDGFGYHTNITTDVLNRKLVVVEIDCVGKNNGSIGNSNNASSTHDGVHSIRINGVYSDGNRPIHDIRGSKSIMLGCISKDGKDWGGNYVCGDNLGTDLSYMWLDGCSSSGLTSKSILKWTQGEIYAYNFVSTANSLGYAPLPYEY